MYTSNANNLEFGGYRNSN